MSTRIRRRLLLVLLAAALAAPAAAQDATRPFHLGFTPLPPVYSAFGQGIVYTYLQRDSDLVSHTMQYGVPWPEALQSSDWRTYPSDLRSKWEGMALYDGYFLGNHAKYVSIHAIDYAYRGPAEYWGEQPNMPLPAPWNSYGFDHPDVKQAFLNYAIATVEFFRPEYLGLAVEANILLARNPQDWGKFKELNAYVYTELKERYPDLQVFVTVQYEHMLGLQFDSKNLLDQVGHWYPTVLEEEVRHLLRHSDLLVLSTYPFMAYGALLAPEHYDRALSLAAETGRRLAVEQTGYTSETIQIYFSQLTGSEVLQDAFVAMMLAIADANDFAFVVNFVAIDYGTNYGTDAVAMTWAYTGLWRPDGSAKPAADTWRAHLAHERVPPP